MTEALITFLVSAVFDLTIVSALAQVCSVLLSFDGALGKGHAFSMVVGMQDQQNIFGNHDYSQCPEYEGHDAQDVSCRWY